MGYGLVIVFMILVLGLLYYFFQSHTTNIKRLEQKAKKLSPIWKNYWDYHTERYDFFNISVMEFVSIAFDPHKQKEFKEVSEKIERIMDLAVKNQHEIDTTESSERILYKLNYLLNEYRSRLISFNETEHEWNGIVDLQNKMDDLIEDLETIQTNSKTYLLIR